MCIVPPGLLRLLNAVGVPIFGKMFTNEPVPIKGEITLTDLPGFGAEFNDEVELEEI